MDSQSTYLMLLTSGQLQSAPEGGKILMRRKKANWRESKISCDPKNILMKNYAK